MADDGAEKPMITTPPTLGYQAVVDSHHNAIVYIFVTYKLLREIYNNCIEILRFFVFNDCIRS